MANSRIVTGASAFSAEGSLFADLGKHEIFLPIKTYEPMTIRVLAMQVTSTVVEAQ